ncbi:LssY C-terminal domain-containing protein [Alloacidobacterium dinghuense]|uniref:LssY C-terminal domain-containing protein n=1 Tax=Alloacidobacterium dinghuense TaxID=2763107 RepID=A0A7G8BI92_9BACT|nr:LssY C-terminal domain-containing protein [Alloacidobacterium dinghuense]QNI32262.1 LssY C-terminal domain-containing protein [Alloacidobacterium dinghuense]
MKLSRFLRSIPSLTVTCLALSGIACSQQQPAPTSVRPGVQLIELKAPDASVLSSRKGSYSFNVPAGDWTDTGVTVTLGDQLDFSATGTVTVSDGHSSTPDGNARGWKDLVRQFQLNSANSGALIGRVTNGDASIPFPIGASKQIEITTSGKLYLNVNLSSDLTGDGSYTVKMKLSKSPTTATETTAINLASSLSPDLFANIPRRVQDQQGNPGDMVNFAIIGTQDQVQKAFTGAGWTTVDKTTQDAIVHGLIATLSHEAYTEMPMSILYLFGRPQDFSYARADPIAVAAIRHHLRVWKSTETIDGKPLWVGSATHDSGFEKDQRNGNVTHHIDPNIDEERDFIEQSFAAAGAITGAAYVTPSNPLKTALTATGGSFHSDGRIVVLALR